MFKKLSLVLTCLLLFSVSPVMAQDDICEGNFDCDIDVDGTDAAVFKEDFGRSSYKNPCPASGDCCSGTLSPLGRWCDQGNGAVKDMTTGLVWLKDASWGGLYPFWVNTMNGVNAQDRAAQLWDGSPWEGTAGLSDGSTEGDWRLPTKNELVSIAVGTEYIREYSMYFFTNVQSGNYWSSTAFSNMTDGAWYLFIHFATVGWDNKASVNYVWPVRGGH